MRRAGAERKISKCVWVHGTPRDLRLLVNSPPPPPAVAADKSKVSAVLAGLCTGTLRRVGLR